MPPEPPERPSVQPPAPPPPRGDDTAALIREMLRRDDMRRVGDQKKTGPDAPQTSIEQRIERLVQAVQSLVSSSKRPTRPVQKRGAAEESLVREMAREIKEAVSKIFVRPRERASAASLKRGTVRRAETSSPAIAAATKSWSTYAKASVAAVKSADAAIATHRRVLEDMALHSWMPKIMRRASASVEGYGKSWDEAAAGSEANIGATRDALEDLEAAAESSLRGAAKPAARFVETIDWAFAAAARRSAAFGDETRTAMIPVIEAVRSSGAEIDAAFGTGMAERVESELIRAADAGISGLLEINAMLKRIGRDVKIDVGGKTTSLSEAVVSRAHKALKRDPKNLYVRMKLGEFDDEGKALENARLVGKKMGGSVLDGMRTMIDQIWDVIRSPSMIASALVGGLAGGQIVEITNQQTAAAKILGSALGEMNAGNALGQRSTAALVSATARSGADLKEMTDSVMAFSDAANRVSASDLLSGEFAEGVFDAARGLNVEMGAIVDAAGEFSFQLDESGRRALPRVFRSARAIQSEFGVTGKRALELVKTTANQVAEMRRYRQVTQSAADVLSRARAIAAQLKVPEDVGFEAFAKGSETFAKWRDNFTVERVRASMEAAKIADVTPQWAASGELFKTAKGTRAMMLGLAKTRKQIIEQARQYSEPIQQQLFLKVQTGRDTTLETEERGLEALQRQAEGPIETFQRLEKVQASVRKLLDEGMSADAVEWTMKAEGFDSLAGIDKAVTDAKALMERVGPYGEDIQDAVSLMREQLSRGTATTFEDAFRNVLVSPNFSDDAKKHLQSLGPQKLITEAMNLDKASEEMRAAFEDTAQSPADKAALALNRAVGQFQQSAFEFAESSLNINKAATTFANGVEKFGWYLITGSALFAGMSVVNSGLKVAGVALTTAFAMGAKTVNAFRKLVGWKPFEILPPKEFLLKTPDFVKSGFSKIKLIPGFEKYVVRPFEKYVLRSGKVVKDVFLGNWGNFELGPTLSRWKDAFGKFSAAARGYVGEALGPTLSRWKDAFGKFSAAARGYVGEALRPLARKTRYYDIVAIGKKISSYFFRGFAVLFDDLGTGLSKLWSGVKAVGGPMLGRAASWMLKNGLKAFGKTFGLLARGLMRGLSPAMWIDIGALAVSWVARGLSKIPGLGKLAVLADLAKDVSESASGVISGAFSGIWAGIKSIATLDPRPIKDWFSSVSGSFSDWGRRMKELFPSLGAAGDWFSSFWETLRGHGSKISKFWGDMTYGWGDAISGWGRAISNAFASWGLTKFFQDYVTGPLSALYTWMAGWFEKWSNMFSRWIPGMYAGESTKKAIVADVEKALAEQEAGASKIQANMLKAGADPAEIAKKIKQYRSGMNEDVLAKAVDTARGGGVKPEDLVEAFVEKGIKADFGTGELFKAQDKGTLSEPARLLTPPAVTPTSHLIAPPEWTNAARAAMSPELGGSPIGVPATDQSDGLTTTTGQGDGAIGAASLDKIGRLSSNQVDILRNSLSELREIRRALTQQVATYAPASTKPEGYPTAPNPPMAAIPAPAAI